MSGDLYAVAQPEQVQTLGVTCDPIQYDCNIKIEDPSLMSIVIGLYHAFRVTTASPR